MAPKNKGLTRINTNMNIGLNISISVKNTSRIGSIVVF